MAEDGKTFFQANSFPTGHHFSWHFYLELWWEKGLNFDIFFFLSSYKAQGFSLMTLVSLATTDILSSLALSDFSHFQAPFFTKLHDFQFSPPCSWLSLLTIKLTKYNE